MTATKIWSSRIHCTVQIFYFFRIATKRDTPLSYLKREQYSPAENSSTMSSQSEQAAVKEMTQPKLLGDSMIDNKATARRTLWSPQNTVSMHSYQKSLWQDFQVLSCADFRERGSKSRCPKHHSLKYQVSKYKIYIKRISLVKWGLIFDSLRIKCRVPGAVRQYQSLSTLVHGPWVESVHSNQKLFETYFDTNRASLYCRTNINKFTTATSQAAGIIIS